MTLNASILRLAGSLECARLDIVEFQDALDGLADAYRLSDDDASRAEARLALDRVRNLTKSDAPG